MTRSYCLLFLCSPKGEAYSRRFVRPSVHSRPPLAQGLDKPVLHPHPCMIVLIFLHAHPQVNHYCCAKFHQYRFTPSGRIALTKNIDILQTDEFEPGYSEIVMKILPNNMKT